VPTFTFKPLTVASAFASNLFAALHSMSSTIAAGDPKNRKNGS
jgi:hypothetical protein